MADAAYAPSDDFLQIIMFGSSSPKRVPSASDSYNFIFRKKTPAHAIVGAVRHVSFFPDSQQVPENAASLEVVVAQIPNGFVRVGPMIAPNPQQLPACKGAL